MFVLAPLKQPPIASFWTGQVASGVGDELRRVALVWIGVDLIGKNAAYITAAQAATLMVFGMLGGVYADRWDQRRTMIAIDVLRATIAFLLTVAAAAGALGVPGIFGATIALAMLTAFYTPSVQASLAQLVTGGPDMMHAVNGLMDGTRRLARIVGPGIVGLLALIMPIHHFFTVNGFAFLFSAAIVIRLGRHLRPVPAPLGPPPMPTSALGDLKAAIAVAAGHPILPHIFLTMITGTSVWAAVFMICLPLHIQDGLHAGIGAFGLVLSAYGIGNLATNFWLASRPMPRPGRVVAIGRIVRSVGVIAMALAPDLTTMMVAAAVAATGGPTADLPYLVLIRCDCAPGMIGRLFSLRNTVDSCGMLVGMLAAALALDHLSVLDTMLLAGAVSAASCFLGLGAFRRESAGAS